MKFNKSLFLMVALVTTDIALGMSRVPNLSMNTRALNYQPAPKSIQYDMPQAKMHTDVFQGVVNEMQPQQPEQQPWMNQKIVANPSLRSGAFKSTRLNLLQATTPRLMSRKKALSVLKLDEGATEQKIKKAFRDKAKLDHPDVAGGSLQKMQELNDAYETILKKQGHTKSYSTSSENYMHPDDYASYEDFVDAMDRKYAPPIDPWQEAIRKGDFEAVKYFLKKGYKANAPVIFLKDTRSKGYPLLPLELAMMFLYESNSTKAVEELIATGADVNGDNDPNSILGKFLKAIKHFPKSDILRLVKLMIDHGAIVNFKCENDSFQNPHPLFYVVRQGQDPELLNLLLKSGSMTQEQNEQRGYNLLHMAVNYVQDEQIRTAMIDALLKAGVSFEAKDNDGNTPLDLAIKLLKWKDTTEAIQLLKKAGATPTNLAMDELKAIRNFFKSWFSYK